MMQLTDSIIKNALNNSDIMTKIPLLDILVYGLLTCGLAFLCYFHTEIIKKVICGLLAVLILGLGLNGTIQDYSKQNSINNDEWIVVTDRVERVMYRTNSVNPYYLDLKEYGRVTLAGYSEAMEHYSGEKVYVIVIPSGEKYKSTGVIFSMDKYTYTGNRMLK
jgi:hypothetical protein